MAKRSERGSFTIEAILSISVFMFAFLAIAMLAAAAKTQSTVQYAINQTAKEIAQYCYIASKAGLLPEESAAEEEAVANVDEAVGSIINFANISAETSSNYTGGTIKDMGSMMENVAGDFQSIQGAAEKVYSSMGPIMQDPKGALSSVVTLFLKNAASRVASRIIAPPLCRALVPKYISAKGDVDTQLTKMGVVGGLAGLDFRSSSILLDGRTINVTVIYQIKVKSFGLFEKTLNIQQTASTAAWVKGKSITELVEEQSPWADGDLNRGKKYVAQLQKEDPKKAVQSGQGIDRYDQDSNTFTSVHSINIFSNSYSDYKGQGGEGDPGDYVLKEKQILAQVKSYANSLKKHISKIGDTIILADGTSCQIAGDSTQKQQAQLRIVVPDEASGGHNTLLNKIANDIYKETGVQVEWTYRDTAFGSGG